MKLIFCLHIGVCSGLGFMTQVASQTAFVTTSSQHHVRQLLHPCATMTKPPRGLLSSADTSTLPTSFVATKLCATRKSHYDRDWDSDSRTNRQQQKNQNSAEEHKTKSREARSNKHKKSKRVASSGTTTEQGQNKQGRPFPAMPSPHFTTLAQCQFELLANSILHPATSPPPSPPFTTTTTNTNTVSPQPRSKIKSMALYLPRENPHTGQLEFAPAVTYPEPVKSRRVFIANDARAKRPPNMPRTITSLSGFARAKSVLPHYPFASSSSSVAGGSSSSSSSSTSSRTAGGAAGGRLSWTGAADFPTDDASSSSGSLLFDEEHLTDSSSSSSLEEDTACGCGPVEELTSDEILGRDATTTSGGSVTTRMRPGNGTMGFSSGVSTPAAAASAPPVLSVPLYRGSSTVGVLVVWPSSPPPPMSPLSTGGTAYWTKTTTRNRGGNVTESTFMWSPNRPDIDNEELQQQQQGRNEDQPFWTERDLQQVSRATYGLAIALTMDQQQKTHEVEGGRSGVGERKPFMSSSSSHAESVDQQVRRRTPGSSASSSSTSSAPRTSSESEASSFSGRSFGTNTTTPTSGGNTKSTSWSLQPGSASDTTNTKINTPSSYEELLRAQRLQTEQLRVALADNLHQVKNPLQALRTYGKLLQRKLAEERDKERQQQEDQQFWNPSGNNQRVATGKGGGRREQPWNVESPYSSGTGTNWTPLQTMADQIVSQSDRVADLLLPIDGIVQELDKESESGEEEDSQRLLLPPASAPMLSLAPMEEKKSSLYLPDGRNRMDDTQLGQKENWPGSQDDGLWRRGGEQDSVGNNNENWTPFDVGNGDSVISNRTNDQVMWFEPLMGSSSSSSTEPAMTNPEVEEWGAFESFPSNDEFSMATPSNKFKRDKDSPRTSRDLLVGESEELEMSFLPDVIEPILSAAAVIAADKGVTFQVHGMAIDLLHDEGSMKRMDQVLEEEDLPGVRIRPKALQEALANILDNAIQYSVVGKQDAQAATLEWGEESMLGLDGIYKSQPITPPPNPHPYVRVSVFSNDEPFGVGVTIIVEDNGPGIAPSEREKVFQRGYRGSRTKNVVPGKGIGLDISRSYVKSMGGELKVLTEQELPRNYFCEEPLDGMATRLMLFRDP